MDSNFLYVLLYFVNDKFNLSFDEKIDFTFVLYVPRATVL